MDKNVLSCEYIKNGRVNSELNNIVRLTYLHLLVFLLLFSYLSNYLKFR